MTAQSSHRDRRSTPISRRTCLTALAASLGSLAACSTGNGAGRNGIRLTEAGRAAPWKSYRRVVVRDFADRVSDQYSMSPVDVLFEKRREMGKARVEFADKLAGKLRATGTFAEVLRAGDPQPGDLLLEGALLQWNDGDSDVRRGTRGRYGQAGVQVRIELLDGAGGRSLASMLADNGTAGLGQASAGGLELSLERIAERLADGVAGLVR